MTSMPSTGGREPWRKATNLPWAPSWVLTAACTSCTDSDSLAMAPSPGQHDNDGTAPPPSPWRADAGDEEGGWLDHA